MLWWSVATLVIATWKDWNEIFYEVLFHCWCMPGSVCRHTSATVSTSMAEDNLHKSFPFYQVGPGCQVVPLGENASPGPSHQPSKICTSNKIPKNAVITSLGFLPWELMPNSLKRYNLKSITFIIICVYPIREVDRFLNVGTLCSLEPP